MALLATVPLTTSHQISEDIRVFSQTGGETKALRLPSTKDSLPREMTFRLANVSTDARTVCLRDPPPRLHLTFLMAVDHSGGIFIFSFLLFFLILSLFSGAFFNSGINSDNFAIMQNLGATFHAHPDRSSVSDFQHRPPTPCTLSQAGDRGPIYTS